jgi:hypothetical protein
MALAAKRIAPILAWIKVLIKGVYSKKTND